MVDSLAVLWNKAPSQKSGHEEGHHERREEDSRHLGTAPKALGEPGTQGVLGTKCLARKTRSFRVMEHWTPRHSGTLCWVHGRQHGRHSGHYGPGTGHTEQASGTSTTHDACTQDMKFQSDEAWGTGDTGHWGHWEAPGPGHQAHRAGIGVAESGSETLGECFGRHRQTLLWQKPSGSCVRRDTCMTASEKISGQKCRKETLPLGEQVLARHPGANVNQLLQPWFTGFRLGRDTLTNKHLVGTAAGVMRSRAVRRLQEPARWVPKALQTLLFTPWAPHLNLPGRSLQRPAWEEPGEARTLLRFIETPRATTKQKPKPAQKFVTLPDAVEQPTKREGDSQRTISARTFSFLFFLCRGCMFLIHRYRHLHVNCHPPSEKAALRNVRGQRR